MKGKISRRNFIGGSILGAGALTANLGNLSGDITSNHLSTELPKRRLGRTGKMISCIGFGGGSRYAMAPERVAGKLRLN